MKTPRNIKIGRFGEEIAYTYLIKKKWTVLSRNFRRKGDEIDIIARSPNGPLVFIEVKTLIIRGDFIGKSLVPEDNFTPAKRLKLTRICQFFIRKYAHMIDLDAGWQIDLIAIGVDDEKRVCHLRHYQNV